MCRHTFTNAFVNIWNKLWSSAQKFNWMFFFTNRIHNFCIFFNCAFNAFFSRANFARKSDKAKPIRWNCEESIYFCCEEEANVLYVFIVAPINYIFALTMSWLRWSEIFSESFSEIIMLSLQQLLLFLSLTLHSSYQAVHNHRPSKEVSSACLNISEHIEPILSAMSKIKHFPCFS